MKNLKEKNYESSKKKITKAVAPMAVILALSQALSANPNTGTNINQSTDNIFTDTKTTVKQSEIINNKKTADTDANWKDFIDRDPNAIEKAEKKINKAKTKSKLDLDELWLTTHEIDSLLELNIEQLQNLKVLILSGNNLSSWLPEMIFKLKNLEELELQGSMLPETITIQKGEFKIEKLYIGYNSNLKYINWIQYILNNLIKLDRAGTKIKKAKFTQSPDKQTNKDILKKINQKVNNKWFKYR